MPHILAICHLPATNIHELLNHCLCCVQIVGHPNHV